MTQTTWAAPTVPTLWRVVIQATRLAATFILTTTMSLGQAVPNGVAVFISGGGANAVADSCNSQDQLLAMGTVIEGLTGVTQPESVSSSVACPMTGNGSTILGTGTDTAAATTSVDALNSINTLSASGHATSTANGAQQVTFTGTTQYDGVGLASSSLGATVVNLSPQPGQAHISVAWGPDDPNTLTPPTFSLLVSDSAQAPGTCATALGQKAGSPALPSSGTISQSITLPSGAGCLLEISVLADATNSASAPSVTVSGHFNLALAATTPHICFNGQDVAAAPTLVNVAVGQPISLAATTDSTCQNLAPAASSQWSLTGKAIARYTWDESNFTSGAAEQISADALSSPATGTFYWTSPGLQTAQYSYTTEDGTSSQATVTFLVVAPYPLVQVSVGQLQKFSDPTYGAGMELGNWSSISGIGIVFDASQSALPSSFSGGFYWLQVLGVSTNTKTSGVSGGTSQTCTDPANSLDNQVPYDTGPKTFDTPKIGLPSWASSVSWQFGARMYLMWKPSVPTGVPIPAPLGYVDWAFFANAVQSGGQWSVAGIPNSPVFVPSTDIPTWTGVSKNTTSSCVPSP